MNYIPGSYFYGISKVYPILTSMPEFTSYGINDQDQYFIVQPGYKLIVYQADNYSGLSMIFDNTNGTNLARYNGVSPNANQASSCKLYYRNTLIPNLIEIGPIPYS